MLQRIIWWVCDLLIGKDGGSYVCPKCNGKGRVKERHVEIIGFSGNMSWTSEKLCDRCNGNGELDWVQKVTGRSE